MDIHLKLNELLDDKHISVAVFAQEIGVSRTTAYKYLKGTIGLDVYTLMLICEKFNAPLSRFVIDKEKSDLLNEVQELKQKVNKLENITKALLVAKWFNEGKKDPPRELANFPEFKELEVMFQIFSEPSVVSAFNEVMEPRMTKLEEVIKKRKDK
ncbi:MAG: helix-turn-helix transcriptional regulator [Bacteroidetes bacterium]|nr:helix-turn-helix transcriptional regulator [Bacteroidota bacterium]